MIQMVNEEARVALYQDYVTTGIKIIAEAYAMCHGGSLQLPSFIELTHAVERQQTKEEIIAHVKQLFEG